jgi:hypothetical protein
VRKISRKQTLSFLILVLLSGAIGYWWFAKYGARITSMAQPLLSNSMSLPPSRLPAAGHDLNARLSGQEVNPVDASRFGVMGAGAVADLRWKNLVAERNTDWAIRQLMISSNPDDWYKAASLAKICAATASITADSLEDAIKTDKIPAQRGKEIVSVHADARARCTGLEGEPYPFALMRKILLRAKESGSALAAAPQLTEKVAQDGLRHDEAERLKAILSNAENRSAWITSNITELATSISKSSISEGMTTSEISAALYKGMCLSGDDCGEHSFYKAGLCVATAYEMCSATGVEHAFSTALSAERMKLVAALSERLLTSFDTANLRALGIGVVASN